MTVRQPHPRALNSGADSVVPAVFPPPAISGRASNAVTQYTVFEADARLLHRRCSAHLCLRPMLHIIENPRTHETGTGFGPDLPRPV